MRFYAGTYSCNQSINQSESWNMNTDSQQANQSAARTPAPDDIISAEIWDICLFPCRGRTWRPLFSTWTRSRRRLQMLIWSTVDEPEHNLETTYRLLLICSEQKSAHSNLFTWQMILLFQLRFDVFHTFVWKRFQFFWLAVKTSCLLKLIRTLTEHSDIPQHLRTKYFGPVQT